MNVFTYTTLMKPSNRAYSLYSGGFRVAGLPGQVTHAVRAVGLWVEKIRSLPLTVKFFGLVIVFTVGGLCPIIPQDNIVISNKHN